MRRPLSLVWMLALVSAGCASLGASPAGLPRGSETGIASYYASAYHGHRTASGETYDERTLTAAHRTLPFGTRLKVTNLRNGRSVVVRVVDRGPFVRGRIVDVSKRAARELAFLGAGLTRVRIEVVDTSAETHAEVQTER